jgi:hypothetical protein
MEGNYMANAGSIIVEITEEGHVAVSAYGGLTHLEIVGALTMAVHNLEFSAMSTKDE